MFYKIDDNDTASNIGNKATNLMILKKNGFNVPNGIIISSEIYDEIKANNFIIPANIKASIEKLIDSNKKYAVRSSGTKEDLKNMSFAGQYHTSLNVSGLDSICSAIIECYKSINSSNVISYSKTNGVDTDELKMAVIIQEMIDSDISGVCFTVNPMTGNDKEIVIEVAKGLGENIVSGKVTPEQYIYNWYDNIQTVKGDLLSDNILREMNETFLQIQVLYGYPCDIEFAIKDEQLHILQTRAVTKLLYNGINNQWTTADFKDGGVSAEVCKPYMWSLYEYIWNDKYKRFLNKSLLVNEDDLSHLGEMFYGRPYWNLSAAKIGMAMVPGYNEREFDNSLGVKITYEGDGVVTKYTARSLVNAVRILSTNRKMTKNRLKNNPSYRKELLLNYEKKLKLSGKAANIDSAEQEWMELVFKDYHQSEGTYFEQIFINTVGQSIYKDSLSKYCKDGDYLNLLSGLDDISHLRPYINIWSISRKIRKNKSLLKYWQKSSVAQIKLDYDNNRNPSAIFDLLKYIKDYGYHSDKELDVTYPHYIESPEPIIKTIKNTIKLNDDENPRFSSEKQKIIFSNQLNKISETTTKRKNIKLLKSINEMRRMLWWREELRDISTKYYYLIRIYTIKLAEIYTIEGIINHVDDIWFLKIADINNFISKKISKEDLQSIIARNIKYYKSFRNYVGENEIGHSFDNQVVEDNKDNKLHGVGCNSGVVTGKAKIIRDLAEIDRVQAGDILVTKYTDTGWTSKFAILKGIITEYGGVLCHAAIVSREYGIPCIVCAHDAMNKIADGQEITINGSTGEIRDINEKNIY